MKKIQYFNTFTRCTALILSALFMIPNIFALHVNTESSAGPSDRDLLILSLLTYKTEFKENAWEMNDDIQFNNKWFGDDASTSEIKGWKTVNYEINSSEKSGFCAATFKKDDNIVVSFKGVDNARFLENWKTMIPNQEHPRAKFARQYVENLRNAEYINENSKIYFSGYCLGGYLCMYGAGVLLNTEGLSDKFVKAVTFNGLGLGHIDKENESIRYELSKLSNTQLVNYRICGDLVSTIGEHITKINTLKFIPIKRKFFSLLYWTHGPHISHHFFVQEPFVQEKPIS